MEDQHIMRPLAPMLAVSRVSWLIELIRAKLILRQLMHGADMIGVPTRAVHGKLHFPQPNRH
jgi:hypothetical protein